MAPPVPPRPAATLLLLRDAPLEVLMIRRSRVGAFASALVFPGGVVGEEDRSADWPPLLRGAEGLTAEERACRIAALRETFEEAGLLLVEDAAGGAVAACAPAAGTAFIDTVRASGGVLALERLIPFAHWITPEAASKRYDTRFYALAAPAGQDAVCDGVEAVTAEWRRPAEAVAEEADLPFPTRLNLLRLAESASVDEALAAARARPAFTVLPRAERDGDRLRVTIPAEAGYGVTEDIRIGDRII